MNYNNNFGDDNVRKNVVNGLKECVGLVETFQKCFNIRGIEDIREIELRYKVEPPQPK